MTDRETVRHLDFDAGDGLSLHIAESGDGPPLLLLHGFTGSTETWTPFRSTFDAAYTVLAIDHSGHGRSTSPPDADRYRLARFSNDLVQLIDSLSLERVAVAGYSMGGRAALRFAIDHADRVAALILESTTPGIRDATQRLDRRAYDGALAKDIERDGIEGFVARWEKLGLWDSQRNLPDAVRAALRKQRLLNNASGLANSLRGAGSGEDDSVMERASAIHCPVLLIVGALDTKYTELGRRLEKAMPNAKLTVVAKSGHAVHLEQPEVFTSAVMDFLATIPSGGSVWT